MLHVAACNLTGTTATHQGELALARRWLEQGLVGFEEVQERMSDFPAVIDLGVSMGARLSQTLAHLGLVDSARTCAETALARARALGHPYAEMLALFFAGVLEVRIERAAQARTRAEAIEKIVVAHGFVQGEGLWRWLLGWALARDGQVRRGHALMLEGYGFQLRQHLLAGAASVLGHACEAMILAQQWADAQKHVDDGMALAAKIGERIFLPDLLLHQGRIALARADRDKAHEAMRAALAEAKAQQAAWLELSALVALCGLPDPAPGDFTALALARERQHEGLDTALVARADALLRAAPASD
jgi:adenylate cyclase